MHERHPDHRPLRVVVAGGGIAGLEAIVALRAFAGERVEVTLIDPVDEFRVKALLLGEPFGLGRARRYARADLTRRLGAAFVRDSVHRVQSESHVVLLRSGKVLEYDVLLLAVGGAPYPALSFGTLLDPEHEAEALATLRARLEAQPGQHVAVVVPAGVGWTLPAYEVASMLSGIRRTRVTVVTAEDEPLEVFGPPAAAMARAELAADDIALVGGVHAEARSASTVALDDGRALGVDHIVHLPRHAGPRIPGVPCDADGFILADADGRVEGHADLLAAGDGIAGAIGQGGLAAQQAERVAAAIARRAGADIAEPTGPPVLRAVLRTRRGPRYLRAQPPGGHGRVEISRHSLWWPPTKVSSAWLMPWLATQRGTGPPPPPDTAPAGTRWADPTAGHRSEPTFRRVVAGGDGDGPAGEERPAVVFDVTFDRCGWRLVGGRRDEPLTLDRALGLLTAADRDDALATHAAALRSACAAVAALGRDERTAGDEARLGRLAVFAERARALAAELHAVRAGAATR